MTLIFTKWLNFIKPSISTEYTIFSCKQCKWYYETINNNQTTHKCQRPTGKYTESIDPIEGKVIIIANTINNSCQFERTYCYDNVNDRVCCGINGKYFLRK